MFLTLRAVKGSLLNSGSAQLILQGVHWDYHSVAVCFNIEKDMIMKQILSSIQM